MTCSTFIGLNMLHGLLIFRSLVSFFSASLQASFCWNSQYVQASISVKKNRKLPPHFPQGWFSMMIHTASSALHRIREVFTSGTVLWLAISSEVLLSPAYPSSTPVLFFTGSNVTFLCGPACIFIIAIWRAYAFRDEVSKSRILWITTAISSS